MERKGRLVTIEGIDGIGKSTQAELLALNLKQEGYDVLTTKEPGASLMGAQIRSLLFKEPTTRKMANGVAATLFIAEHLQTIHDVIRPALNAGKVVICDRYCDSNLAYWTAQGAHPAVLRFIREMYGPVPDVTILFVGDPAIMADRAQKRSDPKQAGKVWADSNTLSKIQLAYETNLGTASRTLRLEVTGGMSQKDIQEAILPKVLEKLQKVESRSSLHPATFSKSNPRTVVVAK